MNAPYTPQNYALEESIGYLLRRAGAQLTQTVDRRGADYGLTHAQAGIFLIVAIIVALPVVRRHVTPPSLRRHRVQQAARR